MTAIATDPLLRVDNLTTAFGSRDAGITAVRNVSFEVGRGRVLGIVGESGSGKSVTARSILRLLRKPGHVREGSVKLAGRELLTLPEEEMRKIRGKDIAMVFQDPQSALNPVMRVGDQIVEALEVHGVKGPAARERARELLRQVGIPDVERNIDNYPHEFSGGMRQRVVISIALANHPSLLLADEPTTALDVTIQAQILRLLVKLRDELGVSIVMITHDMGVVAELCDDLVVMYGGRVVETGLVNDVLTAPRHPYTAALLRSVPRLDADDAHELPAIPGQPPIPAFLPSGCAFHPRCAHAIDACREQVPPLAQLQPGHRSACHVAQAGKTDLAPPPSAALPARAAVPDNANPFLKVTNLRTDVATGSGGMFRKHTPVYAVDGISFDVYLGQTFGLVGESGCGKSSLSRSLVGINQPTSGTIELDGRDVTAMTTEDRHFINRRVQYVYQDPSASLNPRRTIAQSLEEALAVVGLTGRAARARAADLMNTVGLAPHFLSRYPFEISGGQRQRVGIARALAVEPKLLICDEPVSALDVSIQAQIINLLDDLKTELGLGYLFIAHDLAVVKHISDMVAVMYLGRLVETGTTDDVYNRPRHPYTQALLSATPEADVTRRDRERIYLGGELPSPANPPSGCRFRTRCPIGPLHRPDRQICSEQDPALATRDGCSKVACHFAAERDALLLAEAQNPEGAQQR